jgi:general secretion pathway protein G
MTIARTARRLSSSGFSLIEIIIAVAIVGILAATAATMLTGNIDDAKDKAAMSDLETFQTQLIVYESNAGRLPTTEQGIKVLWEKPSTEPLPERWRALLEDEKKDPWGNPYKYAYPATKSKKAYDLWSVGKDGADGTDDDVGNYKKSATAAK